MNASSFHGIEPARTGALRVSIPGTEHSFFQSPDDPSLLQAALRAGLPFPYECSSGGCGTCRIKITRGTFESLWAEAPGLSESHRRRGFALACQMRATTDLDIAVTLGPPPDEPVQPRRQAAVLVDVEQLTRDMRLFRFRAEGRADFIPGQYAICEFGAERRAYSMSNLPNDAGLWEFIVKRVPSGRFTEALFEGRTGSMTLDGPYGLAHVRSDSTRDVLCVAGGSGLSPIVSIARSIATDPAQRHKRIDFLYGGRTPVDLCAASHLCDLPGFGERIVLQSVVSERDHPLCADWSGATGFVHEAVARHLGSAVREREIYFAGPPPMAEAMQRTLILDLGVPFQQIHFDRFF